MKKFVKAKKVKCWFCKGYGYTLHENIMGTTSQRTCQECNGRKYILKEI